ncbi:hypothetical protein [Ornithinimicrobium sp. W1665]|uniref:hypothetical protein n=1 Tax=Ornithinimicrobium sp. W1665 TaxID=3416666 RepID=UPI003CF537B1
MDVPADPQQALAHAVQELYAAPAAEFVTTRTALAKELRAAKHREVAKELGAMRKPSVSAAAVNTLVRAEDAVVDRLVDLGGAMRHATSAFDGRALAALRSDRDELLRDWVRAAAEHAEGPLTAAVEAEVRDTAVAALADAAATEVVTSGHLTRALSYSGFGEVDLADAVARTSTGVVLTRIEGGRVDEEDGVGDAEGQDGAAEAEADDGDGDGEDLDGAEDGAEDGDGDEDGAEDGDEDGEDGEDEVEEDQEDDEQQDDEADEPPDPDVDALEMELDEAEKVVAAARAERRRAAAAETEAEDEVRTAAEVVAQAEEALREARAELTAAEESHARAQDGLTQAQQGRVEAEEALQAARRRRDEARVALEEAEDA